MRQADYDNGNVIKVTELDGSQTSYDYDDLKRLISAVRTGTLPFSESYVYDASDNRTQITRNGSATNAVYDNANQMTSYGGVAYTYDRNGNLTGFGNNSRSYDAADKWTSGTVNGTTSIAFGYDGQGRRVSRTVGTARTDFWYDITGLTLETGAANSTVLRDPKGRLLSLSSGTMFANFGRDRLGSVTALVGTNQALTATYNYKPYQYTGTYLDTATGSYQMGARYYERKLGRFSQLDPLPKNLISVNRYAYVGCNPTNFTDPTGLDVIDACLDNALPSLVGGAAIGAVGGFAAGSFGGPAGSVAGTVGGVIAGGILGAAEGCIEGTVEYLIS